MRREVTGCGDNQEQFLRHAMRKKYENHQIVTCYEAVGEFMRDT
jgi:hypothetical protein